MKNKTKPFRNFMDTLALDKIGGLGYQHVNQLAKTVRSREKKECEDHPHMFMYSPRTPAEQRAIDSVRKRSRPGEAGFKPGDGLAG